MDKMFTLLRERRRLLRVILLGLLIAALAGPWFFERLYVPAAYPCDTRLEGDYCGSPIAGLWMVGGVFGAVVYQVRGCSEARRSRMSLPRRAAFAGCAADAGADGGFCTPGAAGRSSALAGFPGGGLRAGSRGRVAAAPARTGDALAAPVGAVAVYPHRAVRPGAGDHCAVACLSHRANS